MFRGKCRALWWITFTLLILLAQVGAAYAQSGQARVVGTIKDSSGAVIPGATVTSINERTGSLRMVTTNERGSFVIPSLQPSVYTVKATASGFAVAEMKGVSLLPGEPLTVNLNLKPAGISESIVVSSEDAGRVDTSSARIGSNVNEKQVEALPLNGRQISQLYLLAPGAVNFSGGTFDDVRFNGRSFEQNAIRFDGIEAGGIITNNPSNIGGELGSLFRLQTSMENVQEFRVDSSNYPAELGTGTGGQISIITKSGSNALHGSAFEYFRNDALDARNFFDGANPSVLRLNQFGGSLGGPIEKDKIFFFGGFEALKQRTQSPFVQNTLSSAVRGLRDCAPGEKPSATTPTCMSANIRPLLAAFPMGQSSTSSPFFDQANVREPGSIDEYSGNIRFDFRLSGKQSMYFRYNRDQGYGLVSTDSSGSYNTETAVPQNLVLAHNWVISPKVVNELKVGYNGSKTRLVGYAPAIPGLDLSGVTISLTGAPTLGGVSQIATPTGQVKISSAFSGRGAPYTNYSLSFIDNLTWLHNNHNTKFGVEIRPQSIKSAFLGGTTYSFSGIQGFLAGTPSQVQVIADSTDKSPFTGKSGFWNMRQTFYIGYAQDEWKLRPNFTMSYGLRFEYYAPMHETNDRVLWFDVPTGTLIPNYTGDWYTMRKNLGPRLGFTCSSPAPRA